MENLSSLGTVKELLRRHNLHLKKGLGQNFLINPTVAPRMAEESGITEETSVLEIGPGLGVLTVELAKRAKKVVSLEVDRRLEPVLQETLVEYPNTKIVWEDVMEVDLQTLFETEFPKGDVVVCANLPYYITTPIIMRLLEEQLPIRSITVMVQKEAAERLCAPPGVRATGAISVAVWYYSQPKILFPVSRDSFMPPPDVDSAVIRLDVRREPAVCVKDTSLYFKVVKVAFSQRRKTILNTLSSGFSLPKETLSVELETEDISPSIRAERLTLEDFATVTHIIERMCAKDESSENKDET